MNDYLLKKDKKKQKTQNLILPQEGFRLNPKLKKHESMIDIKDLTIVEENTKKELIIKQFDRQFRKLIAIMMDITNSSNSTTSDCAIALNEVAKVRDMIERKAAKDLKRNELEKLNKKLALVEGKLQNKMLEIRTNQMLQAMSYQNEEVEERGKSR